MHPAIPICMVFVGCCSNVVFLELLVKEVPSCGNIVTFAQFAFIAIEGFIFATKCGRKKSVIPIRTYLVMVLLFFATSTINNYALAFHISMPLHMIFRAGSLMANLILGVIILKKRYPLYKYLSVLMITMGIAMSTIASSKEMESSQDSEDSAEASGTEYFYWLIGIALLTTALFLSARMGIYQETVYSKHGKHPAEALFYNHALPLPLFLFLASDIYKHIQIFSNSAPLDIPIFSQLNIPRLWVFLIGNLLTQYVCIRSVFILTSECASLTVTLVVTLRKFVSLIFSILYFQNPFTYQHMVGTVLVFGGTFLFVDMISNIQHALFGSKDKQKVQ